MSIPAVPVTVRLYDQDGNPVSGASVTAKLTTTERYGGYVVPKEYRGETDANGVAVVNVFPNELGTEGSEYKFKIVDMATGKTVSVFATVPNVACELHQISELEPYLVRGAGTIVTAEVAGYATDAANSATAAAASATAAAGSATTAGTKATAAANSATAAAASAVTAETKATQANDASVAAQGHAATAGTMASSASTSATAAANSATAAAGSATTATTKATAAGNSATAAAASADTATLRSTDARNSADAAALSASQAATSASSATTSAATASTKATEAANSATLASQKAYDASASASSASTSAGNALSEANRAKTEADRAEAAASAGQATTTTLGTVMIASSADAIAGTDDQKAMTPAKTKDAVLALRPDPTTPPQFDNDASVATTAFVQRALGNLRGYKVFAASGSLDAADAGKWVAPTAAGVTITLPAIASVPDGVVFSFYGNANGCVIQRAGTDLISLGANGNVTSITLGAYDRVQLVKNVNAWYGLSGDILFKHSSSVVPVANGGTGRSDGVFKIGDSVGAFVAGPSSGSEADVRSVAYLAQYRKRSSSITGAIVFRAPTNASWIMQQFIIDGLLYNSGVVKILVQGYRASGATSLSLLYKVSLGSVDVSVRLGTDADGKTCIVLGDAGSVWVYPHFTITNALFGHSGATDDYCKGWTAGIVTDLSGYTLSSTIPSAPVAANITGNAATATLATTAADMAAGHVLAGKTTAEAVRGAIGALSPEVGKYKNTRIVTQAGGQALPNGVLSDILTSGASTGELNVTSYSGYLGWTIQESGVYRIDANIPLLPGGTAAGYAHLGINRIRAGATERAETMLVGLPAQMAWVSPTMFTELTLQAGDVVYFVAQAFGTTASIHESNGCAIITRIR